MSIKQLLDLIKLIVDAIKEALRQKRIKDFRDAKNASLDKQDNRILEEALGGSSGPSDPSKYPGLYERRRKDAKK